MRAGRLGAPEAFGLCASFLTSPLSGVSTVSRFNALAVVGDRHDPLDLRDSDTASSPRRRSVAMTRPSSRYSLEGIRHRGTSLLWMACTDSLFRKSHASTGVHEDLVRRATARFPSISRLSSCPWALLLTFLRVTPRTESPPSGVLALCDGRVTLACTRWLSSGLFSCLQPMAWLARCWAWRRSSAIASARLPEPVRWTVWSPDRFWLIAWRRWRSGRCRDPPLTSPASCPRSRHRITP